MSKFATATPAPPKAPIATTGSEPDALTHEGGAGFSRDAKSELFLLAVTNMVSEDTFYEKAGDRDARFEALVAQVTKEDPDWVRRFIPYLRGEMNMRSASVVMAAEYVRAGGPKGRAAVDSALVRADEPAEMLGYWLSRYGRKLPKPVKRGVADAVERLYSERNFIKYDGDGKVVRMADVIELTHPSAKAPWQAALYKHALASRHKHPTDFENLPTLAANEALRNTNAAAFREAFSAEAVEAAGMTWEQASSQYGKLDGRFWDTLIPTMGIFALVRNLRNFDDHGISDESRAIVKAKLTDADVIAKSRMFPFRFYAAHVNTKTLHWGEALETAVNLSVANVPSLPGRTLILVDHSGSMAGSLSARSTLDRRSAASLFAAAVALRAEKATLVPFASQSAEVFHHKVGSALRVAAELDETGNRLGGGTETFAALAKHYDAHDRVIILTDEQAFPQRGVANWSWIGGRQMQDDNKVDVGNLACPIYTFNLAGYKHGHLPSGSHNRYTFGGLSDAGFKVIPLIEANRDADWPF